MDSKSDVLRELHTFREKHSKRMQTLDSNERAQAITKEADAIKKQYGIALPQYSVDGHVSPPVARPSTAGKRRGS